MKLRNKRTGEIVEPFGITCINGRTFVQFDDGTGTFKFEARSLAELNEDWEDYEEPKEHWYIDYCGCICNSEEDPVSPVFMLKKIGNYFETEEEAKKAVEKLKAYKRLKDKGFKFKGTTTSCYENNCIEYETKFDYTSHYDKPEYKEMKADLDLLFSGGEE